MTVRIQGGGSEPVLTFSLPKQQPTLVFEIALGIAQPAIGDLFYCEKVSKLSKVVFLKGFAFLLENLIF